MKWIKRLFHRRHYLLFDGMHSCAYVPKRTYRMLNKCMVKSLRKDAKAENSLRFLWMRTSAFGYGLLVNPQDTELACTHGLTMDCKGRIIIPCPYIQRIYCALDVEPEWCGRVYLEEAEAKGWDVLKGFKLSKI